MELSRQKELVESFYSWFDAGLASVLRDNRRRYRMEMLDAADRRKRGLSALPSTKSASVADRFRERALLEYHEQAESISFTSKAVANPAKEKMAQWLTEIFNYRANNTFPFFTWHSSSLLSAAVDGLEAAMVWWRTETAPRVQTVIDPLGFPQEIESQITIKDTWWIDQLMPGTDVVWDPKIKLMDVNLGQYCMVKMRKNLDEIESLQRVGVFDMADGIDWTEYQETGLDIRPDYGKTVYDPDNTDLGDKNLIEIWCFFFKDRNTWVCQFSIKGNKELSTIRPVNNVFFGGREVNRLPVVVGVFQQKLWESTGRGLPETIAPIEDEWQDQRNNLNDIAKAAAQGGRIRVNSDSDVNLDDVLNSRVFYAEKDEVEFVQFNSGIMESLRASDPLVADINELLPVGIESRSRTMVPKGTNNTLGANQMMEQASNSKLGVQLMTRNETFMKPLLYLIAQLEFAFETDETIARIAAHKAGIMPPTINDMVDFRQLDFEIDVQINAGLGAMPKFQKYQMMQQLFQLGQVLNLPMDPMKFYAQAASLVGFKPETFLNPNPPPPPPPQVDYKCNIDIPVQLLPPEVIQPLLQKLATGQMNVTADVQSKELQKIINTNQQNAMPDRAGRPTQDTTGAAGMGMSQGGQGGY